MYNKRGKLSFFLIKNCKGQVTIFIIIAVVIVAGIIGFFFLREGLGIGKIPASIEPVYKTFLFCLEDKTRIGVDVLESQAGYIELPELELGSPYMPFSSQLNLFGNPIPYWYYISGNNIPQEQIPSEQEMEKSLEKFIEEKITECDFSNYYSNGFEITQEEPKVKIDIREEEVYVNLNMNLEINNNQDTALIKNHQLTFKSKLGTLYRSAKKIYEKEKRELFLENYGIDTLRLYAPVDGVELNCSPKTWDANEIFDNLQEAIESNTLALTTQSPSNTEEKYFFVNAGINENARFINSKNWSNSFEVLPSQETLLIANPVGNQQGLGVLGFCYVPYHFVYNVKYPVLVQVYSGEETFQFPVAIVIQGNKPREPLSSSSKIITSELCPYKNVLTSVKTLDRNLNSIDSFISYECFGQRCDIGKTLSGELTTEFPQCVNGYIVAKAEGFEESRQLYSTTQEGNAEVILNKLYDLDIKLKLNGIDYNGKSIIYFVSEESSKVVSYPTQKKINLSEGEYEISVQIYKDSSIQFNEVSNQKCIDVPSSGLGGVFGAKEKNCFDVKIPSQLVSNALAGGGKQQYSVSEDELKKSKIIEINVNEFNVPKTIEELQNNYLLLEDSELSTDFK